MPSGITSVASAVRCLRRTWPKTWVLPNYNIQASLQRGLASGTSRRSADPAVHAGDFDADPVLNNPQAAENVAKKETVEEHMDTTEERRGSRGTEPLSPPKPPHSGSPRLENTGVNPQPPNPTFQQKRTFSAPAVTREAVDDISCAGLNGSPWPKDAEKEQKDREDKQEDDQEYYKHHKASPLSEIKLADTRKPITRATDGTGGGGSGGKDAIGWRPEKLETAEETMIGVARLWSENAMGGDPDSPQSRVLRLSVVKGGRRGASLSERPKVTSHIASPTLFWKGNRLGGKAKLFWERRVEAARRRLKTVVFE